MGGEPDGILNGIELVFGVAQREISGKRQLFAILAARVEESEHMGEEWQCLGALYVIFDPRGEPFVDRETSDFGGAFDQIRHTLQWHRRKRDRLGQLRERALLEQAL